MIIPYSNRFLKSLPSRWKLLPWHMNMNCNGKQLTYKRLDYQTNTWNHLVEMNISVKVFLHKLVKLFFLQNLKKHVEFWSKQYHSVIYSLLCMSTNRIKFFEHLVSLSTDPPLQTVPKYLILFLFTTSRADKRVLYDFY